MLPRTRSALAPVTLLLAFVLTALLSAAAAVHTLRSRSAAPPSASEAARAFVLLADQLIATFPAEWSAPEEDLDPSLVIHRCPLLPLCAAAPLRRASPFVPRARQQPAVDPSEAPLS